MVSTCGLLEVQSTCEVRSWMDPSEKVPVAVNCCVVPSAKLGVLGVMAIETRGRRTDGDRLRAG